MSKLFGKGDFVVVVWPITFSFEWIWFGWLSFVLIFGHLSPKLQHVATVQRIAQFVGIVKPQVPRKSCSFCQHLFVTEEKGWMPVSEQSSFSGNADVEAAAMHGVGSWEVVSLCSLQTWYYMLPFPVLEWTSWLEWLCFNILKLFCVVVSYLDTDFQHVSSVCVCVWAVWKDVK